MIEFVENILIGVREWVNGKLENKQDVLIPGSGITISGDTISAVIPESLMVHKRLIVDDISEFLYDIKPKTLESYGFTTDDVNRFLDDSLTVEVVVHPIQVFLKLILPGLYKVYDTLLPDALKRLLSNCHKLKFDTQTSEVFPVQKLSEIVYTAGSIEDLLNNWEPVPVEASGRTLQIGNYMGSAGLSYEKIIYIGSFVYSLVYLEYFNFEPMRFWIINDFKLDDSNVKTLVSVTDNKLSLPCFNYSSTKQLGNSDYVYIMFEEILKNAPKDNNYSPTSALMALLKYFNDNFPVEMQSYYEYEGFSDYNSFKTVYGQIANEVGNPSGREDTFIGTRMASAFLRIMRDGDPSQEELDAVYQEGYNLGYNDDSYDDTKNPYTSPSQRYDSWHNGYYQGYQDGHQ